MHEQHDGTRNPGRLAGRQCWPFHDGAFEVGWQLATGNWQLATSISVLSLGQSSANAPRIGSAPGGTHAGGAQRRSAEVSGFPPSGESGEGSIFQPFARTLDGYKREPSPPPPIPEAVVGSGDAAHRASLSTNPGGSAEVLGCWMGSSVEPASQSLAYRNSAEPCGTSRANPRISLRNLYGSCGARAPHTPMCFRTASGGVRAQTFGR